VASADVRIPSAKRTINVEAAGRPSSAQAAPHGPQPAAEQPAAAPPLKPKPKQRPGWIGGVWE